MALRIVHTADVHIGLSYSQYPLEIRERLVEERFVALQRVIAAATSNNADFVVIAGDLFDKQTVSMRDVDRTVDILKEFEGEAVLVLAGNHDYFAGEESTLWQRFQSRARDSNVVALLAPSPQVFRRDNLNVTFYPCPCPSKHGREPMTGWVAGVVKDDAGIHLGIAHGNVEGLGLDAEQRYFNMSEEVLKRAGVQTWLLGHIHVPFPMAQSVARPVFFMAGTPAPDSSKCTHAGHAWLLEWDDQSECRFTQLRTGAFRFVTVARVLKTATDVDALRDFLDELDADQTILRLVLEGDLSLEDIQTLDTVLNSLSSRFPFSEVERHVEERLTIGEIGKRYPEGTLPHALLTRLIADAEHPGDAHLALSVIDNCS